MDSITQNSKNTKRYLPHDLKTKENAVKTYLNNGDIEYTWQFTIKMYNSIILNQYIIYKFITQFYFWFLLFSNYYKDDTFEINIILC